MKNQLREVIIIVDDLESPKVPELELVFKSDAYRSTIKSIVACGLTFQEATKALESLVSMLNAPELKKEYGSAILRAAKLENEFSKVRKIENKNSVNPYERQYKRFRR